MYSNNRPSLDNILGRLTFVLLEVLQEQRAELPNLGIKAISTRSPRLLGVEQLRGDAGARLGHLEIKHLVVLVLDFRELAAVDGIENSARVLERAALATLGEAGT